MIPVVLVCLSVSLVPVAVLAQSKKNAKESEKFRTQGDQARKSVEKTRDQLQKTVEAYDALMGAEEKKLQASHKKLTQEIAKSEKMVQDGRKQITAFQETAEGFFALWGEQTGAISNEAIRNASEKRLEAAKAGFQNMSSSLVAAREAYEPFMASLTEQATLLTQDLSPGTIEVLRNDVAPDLHAKAETLFASIEGILSKEQVEAEQVNEILDAEDAEDADADADAEMD
jgi:hypothetical protein